MAIAVASSLPMNQSVTILDMSTLSRTPPKPASRRPASWPFQVGASIMTSPPAIMSVRPSSTTDLSPNRRPTSPPGSANTSPGARYRPMRMPKSERSTPNSRIMKGDTVATD